MDLDCDEPSKRKHLRPGRVLREGIVGGTIGALAAVPLPPEEGEAVPSPLDVSPLQQRLYDKHKIQLPILSWPQSPNRVLRVSAQRYNQIGEYALLADALAEEGIGRGAARIRPRS